MIVKELKLRNFRNFEKCFITFDSKINIILGLNGQGKTNLLESLVFLSTTKSHRINDDQKLIMISKDFSNIECSYTDEINRTIGAVIHQKGKTLLVNKQPVLKSSDFIGLLNVILFSPSDINIFDESPKERRKLMNLEITKVSKKYINSLSNYQKLLKERNLTLKKSGIDNIYLSTLEDQMIENQIIILKERNDFIKIINENINIYFKKLIKEDINVKIEYLSCINIGEENIMKESLKQMYIQGFERDRFTQMSNNGIHRDDLLFKLNNQNVNYIASQGQRRLVVMALKLSLVDYIKEKINKVPILLLDDVLSELDINKQINLLNSIDENIQTIITTSTFSNSLKSLNRRMNIKTVNSGKIVENKEDTK